MMNDADFAPLKQMEAFTDAMFNRVFEFQERKHPAWNPAAPFSQRIQGLPLHALIFSNPDRDPAKFGPTVAPFFPLRGELRRIAHYCRQVAPQPVVGDFACGNGFIGSLLAREGVRVVGVRHVGAKPNQIADFFDAQRYDLRQSWDDTVLDVAFSAWMPSGVNLTPEMLKQQPKLLVHIFTEHTVPTTGQWLTGTPQAYILPADFALIDEWTVTRPKNMLHEIWPDLTPCPEETRVVRIAAAPGYHDISLRGFVEAAQGYDWEAELEMTLLALRAKAQIQAQGIAVRIE